MKWIHGTPREQLTLFPSWLDEAIDPHNEVRLIDAFVNSLDLGKFGFQVEAYEDGRPRYHPSDLLKLFIYGYMNRTRSSRELERASKINMEYQPYHQQVRHPIRGITKVSLPIMSKKIPTHVRKDKY